MTSRLESINQIALSTVTSALAPVGALGHGAEADLTTVDRGSVAKRDSRHAVESGVEDDRF